MVARRPVGVKCWVVLVADGFCEEADRGVVVLFFEFGNAEVLVVD